MEDILPGEDQEASSSTSSPEPPSSTTTTEEVEEEEEEEGEGPVTEELIVMAAYTLGQCRQSSTSTSEKEALAAEQKAISKRFKFEEPFSALQEIPGEFIYWPHPPHDSTVWRGKVSVVTVTKIDLLIIQIPLHIYCMCIIRCCLQSQSYFI